LVLQDRVYSQLELRLHFISKNYQLVL
jgi:hypothetical protein